MNNHLDFWFNKNTQLSIPAIAYGITIPPPNFISDRFCNLPEDTRKKYINKKCDNSECTVKRGLFSNNTGDHVNVLGCEHIFHEVCLDKYIEKWYEAYKDDVEFPSYICPVCSFPIEGMTPLPLHSVLPNPREVKINFKFKE